ncbi:hypothetical protein KIN20_035865 [Parelaphostrongylus tenuis]|uniref:Uncharacterized protein n=1 Tax=Parelaphostrongylus tenuis TaxID=148309 RepID=A0AAD5RC31_PARTN|nr:hypothetical protein KIN20_035865 [Parelaphostrongylus tenuis]
MDIAMLPLTILVVVVCYLILRHHFISHRYSKQTKRLQGRLSKSILGQLAFITLLTLLRHLMDFVQYFFKNWFSVSTAVICRIHSCYHAVAKIFFDWYEVILGLMIRWSIVGLLNAKPNQTKVLPLVTLQNSQQPATIFDLICAYTIKRI